MLFPVFEGQTEAEHRLSFIHSGRNDWQNAEVILQTELSKAEDMLRAYKQSFLPRVAAEESIKQPIHRSYHTRLTENSRFSDFYNDGIEIHIQNISLASFLRIPVKVNGVIYSSCGEISESAANNLRQNIAASIPHAFGLGDAHGGNIMISDDRGQDNYMNLLYIDYEVAGYHSILIDLAKPFHHDIFFEALYADIIRDSPAIE
ncbi:hypothetical protein MMC14_005751 [Varicellaria rhodocarpa]|nr:hypothetical protein [Varicellaria rhodocarpa]